MPYFLIAALITYLALSRRGGGHGWTLPKLPPLPRFWPSGPRVPSPQWPQALSAPAPPPGCASQQWYLPQQREIPAEVTERAKQLLASALPLGAQTVEQIGNQMWRFQVETHGANEMNPNPHRGVGVRLCV
jgi:hypothetical protein